MRDEDRCRPGRWSASRRGRRAWGPPESHRRPSDAAESSGVHVRLRSFGGDGPSDEARAGRRAAGWPSTSVALRDLLRSHTLLAGARRNEGIGHVAPPQRPQQAARAARPGAEHQGDRHEHGCKRAAAPACVGYPSHAASSCRTTPVLSRAPGPPPGCEARASVPISPPVVAARREPGRRRSRG